MSEQQTLRSQRLIVAVIFDITSLYSCCYARSTPAFHSVPDSDSILGHGMNVTGLVQRPIDCLSTMRFIFFSSLFWKVFTSHHFIPAFIGFLPRNHNDFPALKPTFDILHLLHHTQ